MWEQKIFIGKNSIEHVIYSISVSLFRRQCVKVINVSVLFAYELSYAEVVCYLPTLV